MWKILKFLAWEKKIHEGNFWFDPHPPSLHPSANSSLASDFSVKMFSSNFFIKIYLSTFQLLICSKAILLLSQFTDFITVKGLNPGVISKVG